MFIDIENVPCFSNHQNTWLSPYPSFQNAAFIKSNISHRTIKLLFEDIAFFVVFNYRHHHDDFSKRDATIHLNRLQNSSSFQVAPKGIWPSATSYVTTTLPDTIVMLFELRCPVDFFCGDPVAYCFVSRYAFWSWLKNMTLFAMYCCNFFGTFKALF